MEEAAFYKETEDEIWIRAEGHITAAFCPELKSRAFARIDGDRPPTAIRMDLSSCEYMDSTFLGLIVGMNKRLVHKNGHKVRLHQPGQACLSLLKTIGVLALLDITRDPARFEGSFERIGPGPRATAEFLLDAHEHLSNLSEENRERFSTLTTVLKKSIDQELETEEKGGD